MKKNEIYGVDLAPTIGAEMSKLRPCVVISPDEMNKYLRTVIVAPLTSTKRALPTRVLIKATETSGLKNDSYAALDQIKTIDKTRLLNYIGGISEDEKHQVSEVLMEMFAY